MFDFLKCSGVKFDLKYSRGFHTDFRGSQWSSRPWRYMDFVLSKSVELTELNEVISCCFRSPALTTLFLRTLAVFDPWQFIIFSVIYKIYEMTILTNEITVLFTLIPELLFLIYQCPSYILEPKCFHAGSLKLKESVWVFECGFVFVKDIIPLRFFRTAPEFLLWTILRIFIAPSYASYSSRCYLINLCSLVII